MDISSTIIPRSDQLNADDLIPGPVTVTIADVRKGSAEQPVDIDLTEYPGRAYRPSKSMRRVLAAAWGVKTDVYLGRRLTLYREAAIKFGGEVVGGIRISHVSGIDKPLRVSFAVARGKRETVTIQPLPDAPARDWAAEADALSDRASLLALHGEATRAGAAADVLAHIVARGKSLAASEGGADS